MTVFAVETGNCYTPKASCGATVCSVLRGILSGAERNWWKFETPGQCSAQLFKHCFPVDMCWGLCLAALLHCLKPQLELQSWPVRRSQLGCSNVTLGRTSGPIPAQKIYISGNADNRLIKTIQFVFCLQPHIRSSAQVPSRRANSM